MSRAAGLAAALPPALQEGEDDALVDGAAFQLAGGLRGLLHGHGCLRTPANSSRVSRVLTGSCRRSPTAAAAELGSAAAWIHETGSGLRVQIDATAYSAYPPRLTSRAVTPSPMDVPVTPGPTASTVPAASKPSTAFGGSGKTSLR